MGETRIWHGGDLDEARALFPGAPEPWIDLSTGINPVPYPVPELTPRLFERLPAPGDVAELERAAAAAYGARMPETVVAAPGTQVLISVLPHLRAPGRVAILGPTYAEHARAWAAAGHEVVEVDELAAAHGADAAVAVNPNNPDGRRLDPEALAATAAKLQARGGLLVVDEAFADFERDLSIIPHLPDGAVVLRSFGKTFGLAGVRLGFAVASAPLIERIRTALGPWAVSGPAIEIGARALRDGAWLEETARARGGDRDRLHALLARTAGVGSCGTTLYRLIETPLAPALFDHLGRHGLWTRRFQGRPDRLRFGLPPDEAAWRRLDEALRAFRPG
ncbi:threonine-phosphate decarboxylase CobD [Salinarimonas soli]|uniref:threonine-phosphate decarboxylase n=1 Tax=Salinarimonas soli TaxID=1638099 RepID=A0A5B2VUF2_9HYPH|nr:threonine-phosphate decarboxylase CobD [Salinarimonas soli]KAA2242300.1 threonine-phosphate decarboxylase [Salinarimonas soli]